MDLLLFADMMLPEMLDLVTLWNRWALTVVTNNPLLQLTLLQRHALWLAGRRNIGVVVVEIFWQLVCLAMDFFPAAPGVVALVDGVDLAVESAGETVDNPALVKDSDGEVKSRNGAVVELLSVAAENPTGENAPGDQNQAAGVLVEVLAGEDLLLTVVVGLMDKKVGAVAELDGVLKVTLVLKASTSRWLAKLFKLVTQFLSGTMLMVVLPVSTLELKLKRMEPSLLFLTLKCPELTTLVPFHETQQSLLSSFVVP
jgi:hypothetical protein